MAPASAGLGDAVTGISRADSSIGESKGPMLLCTAVCTPRFDPGARAIRQFWPPRLNGRVGGQEVDIPILHSMLGPVSRSPKHPVPSDHLLIESQP